MYPGYSLALVLLLFSFFFALFLFIYLFFWLMASDQRIFDYSNYMIRELFLPHLLIIISQQPLYDYSLVFIKVMSSFKFFLIQVFVCLHLNRTYCKLAHCLM